MQQSSFPGTSVIVSICKNKIPVREEETISYDRTTIVNGQSNQVSFRKVTLDDGDEYGIMIKNNSEFSVDVDVFIDGEKITTDSLRIKKHKTFHLDQFINKPCKFKAVAQTDDDKEDNALKDESSQKSKQGEIKVVVRYVNEEIQTVWRDNVIYMPFIKYRYVNPWRYWEQYWDWEPWVNPNPKPLIDWKPWTTICGTTSISAKDNSSIVYCSSQNNSGDSAFTANASSVEGKTVEGSKCDKPIPDDATAPTLVELVFLFKLNVTKKKEEQKIMNDKQEERCTICGLLGPRNVRYCPHCGTYYVRICPCCHHSVEPHTKFCSWCGTKLEKKQLLKG